MIIVLSDTHLGYDKARRDELLHFVEYIKEQNEKGMNCTRVILLGDILDLWRADPLDALASSMPFFNGLADAKINEIDYIIGNHDHYLLKSIEKTKAVFCFGECPITFVHPYLLVKDAGKNILLTHGHDLEIIGLNVSEKAVYAIYDLIYRGDTAVISTLDRLVYQPFSQVKTFFDGIRKKFGSLGGDDELEEVGKLLDAEKSKMEDIAIQYEMSRDELENEIHEILANKETREKLFLPVWENPRLEIYELGMGIQDVFGLSKELIKRPSKHFTRQIPELSLPPLEETPDIVVYGHTHEYINGGTVINVGCWLEKNGSYNVFASIQDGEVVPKEFHYDGGVSKITSPT